MINQKAKYWWAVCYPENMKDNWQSDIDDLLQLPYAYCIHDKDKDGEEDDRKEHVHVFIAFPNTTTYKHALSVFSELSANGRSCVNECKRVISCRRAYNYLIHDTDECRKKGKFQYSPDERITGNNFDIGAYEQIGLEEREKMRKELSLDLLDKVITDYAMFYQYVISNYDSEYEHVLVAYQGHFDKLCKGCFHKWEKMKELEEKIKNKESEK